MFLKVFNVPGLWTKEASVYLLKTTQLSQTLLLVLGLGTF